jgi:hypothetical protein
MPRYKYLPKIEIVILIEAVAFSNNSNSTDSPAGKAERTVFDGVIPVS